MTSFRRLLEPVLDKLDTGRLPGPAGRATRRATGAQVGLVLGWMSTRVLGQYDLLLIEDEDPEQDLVYYVGPNIVALEKRYGFPPQRVPAVARAARGHPPVPVHRRPVVAAPLPLARRPGHVGAIAPDPKRFADALRRAAAAVRAGQNPLDEAGMLGLVATPEQLEVLDQIQAMMSLLEGHGDITMDRAGADAVPDAALFSRVLRQRRQPGQRCRPGCSSSSSASRPSCASTTQGERFIARRRGVGGPELLARAWEGPEMLPTLDEIRHPATWVARIGPARLATG